MLTVEQESLGQTGMSWSSLPATVLHLGTACISVHLLALWVILCTEVEGGLRYQMRGHTRQCFPNGSHGRAHQVGCSWGGLLVKNEIPRPTDQHLQGRSLGRMFLTSTLDSSYHQR